MKKLYLIGLDNLVDIIATIYLYRTEEVIELNPFMTLLLQKRRMDTNLREVISNERKK